MSRLLYCALLSSAVAAMAGCGASDSSPESVDGDAQGSSVTRQTPGAAFAQFSAAAKANDWRTATSLLTPESQSTMAMVMLEEATYMTLTNRAKNYRANVDDLEALLAKHGVKVKEQGAEAQVGSKPEHVTESIKDLPFFISELTAWMSANGDEYGSSFPDVGEVSDVSIDGDTASGNVTMEQGSQRIEFRRVDGGWLIHLPTEAPDGGGPGGE